MSIAQKQLAKLPDAPGVYFFKSGKEVTYIGKATSLKERVRSYFASDLMETRGPRIVKMVREADDIEWQESDSVLEALILEANLIKRYQPLYNAREKDDKSYNYIVFTKEAYPRIFTVRGRELQTAYDADDFKYVFGPYPHGMALREALRIIRKIFPFRGEKDPVEVKKRTSPLNRQIGLVPRLDDMSPRQYASTIQNLRLFFEGRKQKLIKKLEREMKQAAKKEEFEIAEQRKRQITALQHINDVSLIQKVEKLDRRGESSEFRIEAYDIAHISGTDMTGVMVVIEDGFAKKSDYRRFKIKSVKVSDDTGALREVLDRRLAHAEWPLPKLVVVDGGKQQLNAATKVFEEAGVEIPIVAVTKNERHKARGFLASSEAGRTYARTYETDVVLANSEAHRFALAYHDQLRRKRMK